MDRNQLYLIAMVITTISGGFIWLKGLGYKTNEIIALVMRASSSGATGYSHTAGKKMVRTKSRNNFLIILGVMISLVGLGLLIVYLFFFTTDGYYGKL